MLSEARPEDSIALLTAGGPKMQVQFGGPRDAILKAVSDLEIQPPGREQPGGVLDAILEGANWFQKPRPGDSIFLLTLGFDSEHKTDYRYVQEELTRRRRLRLFSIQFAPGVIGTAGGNTLTKSNGVTWVMSEVGNFTAVPPSVINNQNVTNMSWTTGGYSVEENILGDPQHDYKVTANDLDTIKTAASRMQIAGSSLNVSRPIVPVNSVVRDVNELKSIPIRTGRSRPTTLLASRGNRCEPGCPGHG
jgi:hypothetical protein